MPSPDDLIVVARLLLSAGPAAPPPEAQLRRAVSTAYYAVFHLILRTGAERWIGSGAHTAPGYGLIYRGFAHGRIKSVCEALNVGILAKTVQKQLGRLAVSSDMRNFASLFVALQEARVSADYDPAAEFLPSDSVYWVDSAEAAMAAFMRVQAEEKADVLALMLVTTR